MRDKVRFRDYMREYMRRRRGSPVPLLDAIGPADPVGKVAVPVVPAGPGLTESLTESNAGLTESNSESNRMTRRRWLRLTDEQRRRHLQDLGITTDEAAAEYLESLPK